MAKKSKNKNSKKNIMKLKKFEENSNNDNVLDTDENQNENENLIISNEENIPTPNIEVVNLENDTQVTAPSTPSTEPSTPSTKPSTPVPPLKTTSTVSGNSTPILSNSPRSGPSTPSSSASGGTLRRRFTRRSTYQFHPEADKKAGRHYASEDQTSENWVKHQKHIFILSNAGKPIWSRYGDENQLSSIMGVCSAFVTIVESLGDVVKAFFAGEMKFVFLVRGPLYFVMAARTTESVNNMAKQLSVLHLQIVSLLTGGFVRMFEKRSTYDLRNLLGGTDKLLDDLIEFMEWQPSFLLSSIQCLRLSGSVREQTSIALKAAEDADGENSGLLFAMLISKYSLVQLVRPKSSPLSPTDIDLIFNVANSHGTLKSADSWWPMCLPRFNDKGYLHVLSSFITPDLCLLLFGTQADKFYDFQQKKEKVVTHLKESGALEAIKLSINNGDYSIRSTGIPLIRHFLYKSRRTAQFTSPSFGEPYNLEKKEIGRLLQVYRQLRHRIVNGGNSHKNYMITTDSEAVITWITNDLELYATFPPLTPKENMIQCCNELVQWVKREESSLFINRGVMW